MVEELILASCFSMETRTVTGFSFTGINVKIMK